MGSIVAPLINHLGNCAKDKEHNAALADALEKVVQNLTENPPEPVVKAQPVDSAR